MPCTATVKYDRKLVRRALNRFMFRRLGKTLVLIPGLTALMAVLYWFDMWSLPLSLLAGLLGVTVEFLVYVYYARMRASEGFFAGVSEPTVTFTFDDAGIRTESELGNSEIKWRAFDEILKFDDLWLIVYGKSGYMTLPLSEVTPECRQFIDQKVSALKGQRS